MLRRAVLRLAAALSVALIAGAGCLSPTLPLPPPDEPTTIRPSAQHEGSWEISGDCYEGALVTVFNDRTRKGAVVEDSDRNGRYTVELEAALCDLILISQEVVTEDGEIESSGTSSFVIQERSAGTDVTDACP
ncbi:MAG: hypothetical protein IT372_19770 [Polyangiaceae bacterium]|nr:hypothetical protein [Polyangiaceae bacterium]